MSININLYIVCTYNKNMNKTLVCFIYGRLNWRNEIHCANLVEEIMLLYRHQIWFVCTAKPPKRDRIGDRMFGLCREVGPISEVFLQIYCMSLTIIHHTMTEHKNNHIIIQ